MIFSDKTKPVIESSRDVAIKLNSGYISSYHFLLAVLENENIPSTIFHNRKWAFQGLEKSLKEKKKEASENYYLTKEMETSLKVANYYSWVYNDTEVSPEHIVLHMLSDSNSLAGQYLISLGMTYDAFKKECQGIKRTKTKKYFENLGQKPGRTSKILVRLINSFV